MLGAGISFAVWQYNYKGESVNSINGDDLYLEFLEANDEIISVPNAIPMTDEEGINSENVFEFAVTSKTTKEMDLKYVLNIEKLSTPEGYTELSDEDIKVYLTDYEDNPILGPIKVSELDSYKLYNKTHSHNETNDKLQDKYKLRVWIDQDIKGIDWSVQNKLNYSFKIGIGASQKEENLNNIKDFLVMIKDANYVYDEAAKTPEVIVRNEDIILEKDKDYKVTYTNNVNAGEATVAISGIGSYTGAVLKSFTIDKAESVCAINSFPNLTYPKETTGNITYSCTGDGLVNVTSSDTSLITVGNTSNTSATLTAKNVGTGTVSVKQEEGANYKASENVSSDITIEKSTYTVDVVVQNGIVDGEASKTVKYNDSLVFNIINNEGTDIESVSCTNKQGGSLVRDTNVLTVFNVTNDTTCTVVYKERTYTVTYKGGGDSSATGIPEVQTKRYSKPLTLSSSEPSSNTNEFLGWSTKESAVVSDTWYDPEGEYSTNQDATLYAQWYNVDTLEKKYTGFARSGDFITKSKTYAGGSGNFWTYKSMTIAGNATSGYKGLGVISFVSSTSYAFPWQVEDIDTLNVHAISYRASNSSSDVNYNFTLGNLQLLQRTSSVTTGSVDERIKNIQNVKGACLSISKDDVYVRYLQSGDFSVSAKSSGTKTVSNTLSGYTLMGNVGFSIYNGATNGANISAVYLYGVSKDTFYVRNPYTSTAKLGASIRQLFIRNKSVGTATSPSYGNYQTLGQKRLNALTSLNNETSDYFSHSNVKVTRISKTGLTTNSSTTRPSHTTSLPTKRKIIGVTGYTTTNGSGSGASYANTQAVWVDPANNKGTATITGTIARTYRTYNSEFYYSSNITHRLSYLYIE